MKAGVTINRPPRDGNMAFVRSPDKHSIELLQKGSRCRRGALGVDAEHRQMVRSGVRAHAAAESRAVAGVSGCHCGERTLDAGQRGAQPPDCRRILPGLLGCLLGAATNVYVAVRRDLHAPFV